MIIKTLAELAEPDEASLVLRPLGIDPARVAEGVAEYRQDVIASFELADVVPDTTRASYDRVRTIYSYGVFCYDLYTVAGNQARLVAEQALRERFLPFYGGTVTFVDRRGVDHQLAPVRFSDLFDRDDPLVRRGWRLKLRSGRLLRHHVRRGPRVRPRPGPGQRPARVRRLPAPPAGIRHGTGLYVLTLTGDRISAMTRFDNSVLPWFGLPRSLPSR